MHTRPLGKSGLKIAPLALGGNVFGWTADEPRSFTILDAFVDAGFNLIDTADLYSRWAPGNEGGESETIIGNWLKKSGKRDRVLIATKVGTDMGAGKSGLGRKWIIQAVEESLKRLQIDTIDLYQSHKDDPGIPVEETLEAFTSLIEQGKVRAIGASQFAPGRLKESLEVSRERGLAPYTCLQPLYNLYDRQPFEGDFAPICQENGLGVIPFYSLASGFLSGKYRVEADLARSVRGPARIKDVYFNEKGHKIIRAMDEVSKAVQAPLTSVAIAWLLSKPAVTAPIASATSLEQLRALIRGTELKLDPQSLQLLEAASQ
jgi:aryl-alcohol dehydrogenase-like predicted oxidoreductase